jgi:hypothetical protein
MKRGTCWFCKRRRSLEELFNTIPGFPNEKPIWQCKILVECVMYALRTQKEGKRSAKEKNKKAPWAV